MKPWFLISSLLELVVKFCVVLLRVYTSFTTYCVPLLPLLNWKSRSISARKFSLPFKLSPICLRSVAEMKALTDSRFKLLALWLPRLVFGRQRRSAGSLDLIERVQTLAVVVAVQAFD